MHPRIRSSSILYRALLLAAPIWLMTATPGAGQSLAPRPDENNYDEPAAPAGLMNLGLLLKEMLSSNPGLQAARKRWEAMQTRPGQERALPDPKMELGWASTGALYPGAGLGSDPMANLGVQISQTIPFPGKRALRGSLAWQESLAESFVFQGEELRLAAQMKTAFYALQFDYEAIDVLNRNRALLQRLAKLAENRYSTGQATQQDIIKSQIELSLIETRVIEFERDKQRAAAEINMLLNRDVNAPLNRPEPPGEITGLPPLEMLQKSAMQASPLLRTQRAEIDSRQLGLELSRREYYPDFEVMGGYFNQGSMKDVWEFRVQINLPIFFVHKRRLGVEESIAKLGEAKKSYRAGEQSLNYRIKDLYLVAENSRRLMDLYSKLVVPQASLAMESSLNSYSTGSLDFISVLSNFSAILENEMKYYENRSRLLQAQAKIEELIGKS